MNASLQTVLGIAAGNSVAAKWATPLLEYEDAQIIVAQHLCGRIASASPLSFDEAWDAMIYMPTGMLANLHSPRGWQAIADYVASANRLGMIPLSAIRVS